MFSMKKNPDPKGPGFEIFTSLHQELFAEEPERVVSAAQVLC